MGIAERIGGLPSLTAALSSPPACGRDGRRTAAGPASGARCGRARLRDGGGRARHRHARAFQAGEQDGAFAGLAMGLSALLAAVALPPLARWLVG
jgi:hypothetical protein